MDEASTPKPAPSRMVSSSLSSEDLNMANQLAKHVHERPSDYQAHVSLITLLRKGLHEYIYPPGAAEDHAPRNPRDYDLLSDLRQARQFMESLFSVGEQIFVEWVSDEILLARSLEDRMEIVNLCEKAVLEEPLSTKLWLTYINYVHAYRDISNDHDAALEVGLSKDEVEICKSFFTSELSLTLFERASGATMWRVDDSHIIWNRYLDALEEAIPAIPTQQEIDRIYGILFKRLGVPHMELEATKQKCLSVVMRYFPQQQQDAVFQEAQKTLKPIQRAVQGKQKFEIALQQALQSGDDSAVYTQFKEYIRYQGRKIHAKSPWEHNVRSSLYERALLRFPAAAELWLEHVSTVGQGDATTSVLSVLERATKHCPWSGDLWSRRILRAEVEGNTRANAECSARAEAEGKLSDEAEANLRAGFERKLYNEIVDIRDAATNSVLRDAGGIDEYIKAWVGWTTYLRHHAFKPGSSEDDFDVSYSGIVSASEDVHQAGKQLYGEGYKGDPYFRVDRVRIKFLTEARKITEARQVWQDLLPTHAAYSQFWIEWYQWELMQWGFQRMSEKHRVETPENGPHLPTAVVEQALEQPLLDLPAAISDLYLKHFQLHESVEKLEVALAKAYEFGLKVAEQKEPAAAAADPTRTLMQFDASKQAKRKRDDEELDLDEDEQQESKKAKETPEASVTANDEKKRDRETLVLTLSNLPTEVEKEAILHFFSDLEKPKSIAQVRNNDGLTSSAVIEFTSQESVLSAKTRDGKLLFGGTGPAVKVADGGYSSLYVTNYPPHYNEKEIRQLFKSFGEIAEVRMPSLRFNDKRRFCYVQFLSHDVAKAAEAAMDDTKIGAHHKMLAKIADPNKKFRERTGALSEGREVIAKNLFREMGEQEIRALFEEFGKIERFKTLQSYSGGFYGTCFVTFSSAEEATAALALNNKVIRGRKVSVVIATERGGTDPLSKAKADDRHVQGNNSSTPEPSAAGRKKSADGAATNGNAQASADVEMGEATSAMGNTSINYRAFKVAVFNLPDTVNHDRVQAAMEKHGAVAKIQMRRFDGGAIVLFQENEVDAVKKLKAGFDFPELGPDVRTGKVQDLLGNKKPSNDSGAATSNGNQGDGLSGNPMFKPAFRARGRGVLALGRGGRGRGARGARSGLGFGPGRGGGSAGASSAVPADGAAGGEKKDNAAFRSMFVKPKEDSEQKDTEMSQE